jgi:hypothetical protein
MFRRHIGFPGEAAWTAQLTDVFGHCLDNSAKSTGLGADLDPLAFLCAQNGSKSHLKSVPNQANTQNPPIVRVRARKSVRLQSVVLLTWLTSTIVDSEAVAAMAQSALGCVFE